MSLKLYYSPGACSLSPHISLEEAGLPYEAIPASLQDHKLQDGSDYRKINPLGYVPFLVLDNGQTLHEGPAIIQYIADQVPAKKLAPANGTMERYHLQEWLNFIATEVHKSYGILFKPYAPEDFKARVRTDLLARLAWVDAELKGKNYLMGEFSVADPYLFVVTGWSDHVGLDISQLSNLKAFRERMLARPAVQAAMKAEGLTH